MFQARHSIICYQTETKVWKTLQRWLSSNKVAANVKAALATLVCTLRIWLANCRCIIFHNKGDTSTKGVCLDQYSTKQYAWYALLNLVVFFCPCKDLSLVWRRPESLKEAEVAPLWFDTNLQTCFASPRHSRHLLSPGSPQHQKPKRLPLRQATHISTQS